MMGEASLGRDVAILIWISIGVVDNIVCEAICLFKSLEYI